ncbi:MAG: hypothetical protein H6643_06520 [Caldilineaceae bacterium]|nr:hypothetical protein [Caldilineaceae bacterium]
MQRLARLTGLTETYIEQTNLASDPPLLQRNCCAASVAPPRLDSRFTGYDRDAAGETGESDPSYAAILGAHIRRHERICASRSMLRERPPYEVLTGPLRDAGITANTRIATSTSEALRATISQNPFLKVIIANGYYDLATPYFATSTRSTIWRWRNATSRTCADLLAGHMMYVHEPSLAQLRRPGGLRARQPAWRSIAWFIGEWPGREAGKDT